MYSTSNSLDYQRFAGSPSMPLTSEPAQVKSVSFAVEPSTNNGNADDPEQGKSGSFTLEPWTSDGGEGPIQLEPPYQKQIKTRDPWSTGLCDCFDDVSNCCITCWCPCITFGQVAEIIDKGSTSCGTSGAVYTVIACVTGCSCFYSCFYRAKMRQQYMLRESPCSDCCTHCFCEYCALCQEYRELQNRGFELPLGWQENLERDEGLAMPMTSTSSKAPEVEAEMSR